MKEIASWALETAKLRGASLAEGRIVDQRDRSLATKNGKIASASDAESLGIGIRVIADGAFGFSATDDLSRAGVESCAARAVEIAKASATVKSQTLRMVPEPAAQADWTSPCKIDPFGIAIEQNLELLFAIDEELRKTKGVTLAETSMNFRRYEQWFFSTEGCGDPPDHNHLRRRLCGLFFPGYGDPETFLSQLVWRTVPKPGLRANRGIPSAGSRSGDRGASGCLAFGRAVSGRRSTTSSSTRRSWRCRFTSPSATRLNSIASSAWKPTLPAHRFSRWRNCARCSYGSEIVNVVADATEAHGPGLGTFAYDDEGVAAQCTPIITNGLFTGYLTSRDTAAAIGAARAGGCLRAEGWNRLPIVRMTNVSILPGESPLTLEQLIASTDRGVFMETNRSWSIDDKRYNFQFGCEIGWEIVGGKRGRMLKNPSYSGITTEFWNSMDAICSRDQWTLWGTPNCGKGQPQQVMGTGHGAAPARFRSIAVGTAYKGSS